MAMANGFSGADVAQLRALSSRLKTQAGKLREISASSSAALVAAQWTGNDIDAIRDNWKRKSLPTLTGLAEALQEMGGELERHALEQERTSGAPAGSPASWFDDMRRYVEERVGMIVGILPILLIPGFAPKPGVTPPKAENSNPTPKPVPKPAPEPKPELATMPGSPGPGRLDAGGRRSGYVGDMGEPPYPTYRGTLDGLGAYKGECTSWVAWRRKELGLSWRESDWSGTGGGGEMAGRMGGSPSNPPTLGAIVSDGTEGHVMIVEEIYADGSFRVSEMNLDINNDKQPDAATFRDSSVWKPDGNGNYSRGSGSSRQLVIAP